MMAITISPGPTALIPGVTAPPLLEATTSPPAATTTNRNVPQISAKMRRHSRAWSRKSVDNCRWAIRRRCATSALFLSDFILTVPVPKGVVQWWASTFSYMKRSLIDFHYAEGVRFASNLPERETAGRDTIRMHIVCVYRTAEVIRFPCGASPRGPETGFGEVSKRGSGRFVGEPEVMMHFGSPGIAS